MIDHNLLHIGNIFSCVFYYWRLFLDETIKRQDIICVLSRLQLYTAAKTIARTLCGFFFYTYFRKQMSRETSANVSASISTIHIFRHVTDQFCYFPPLLPFFLHNLRPRTMRAKGIRARKGGRKGETERRRETRVTRKRKWDTTGPHCPDEWVNGQWRSTLKK